MKHKTMKLRSNLKPQFVGLLRKRRINSMEPKRHAMKVSSHALLFENGYLNLLGLNNTNWLDQLESVFQLFGMRSAKDPSKTLAPVTVRNRHDLVTSSIRDLIRTEGLQTLSEVSPDLLPKLFKIWTSKGVSGRSLANYYTAMKWFWHLFGIEIMPMKSYGYEPCKYKSAPQKTLSEVDLDFYQVVEKIRAFDPTAAYVIETQSAKQHQNNLDTKIRMLSDNEYPKYLLKIRDQVPSNSFQIWARKSPAQARRRMLYVCWKFGITKHSLGLTLSGLIKEAAYDPH